MKGYQCSNCQYETMMNLVFCPTCGKQGFQEIDVPNEGAVYSYTTIRVAPPEFISKAPHPVALVELTERLQVTAFIQEAVDVADTVVVEKVDDKAFVFKSKNKLH